MGLSLEDISKGVADWGNVVEGTVKKFNSIAKETLGLIPNTTSAPVKVAKAAAGGTVQEATQKKGTTTQQVAAASGGTGTLLIVALIIGLLIWKG
jgi:hypothetical protein